MADVSLLSVGKDTDGYNFANNTIGAGDRDLFETHGGSRAHATGVPKGTKR